MRYVSGVFPQRMHSWTAFMLGWWLGCICPSQVIIFSFKTSWLWQLIHFLPGFWKNSLWSRRDGYFFSSPFFLLLWYMWDFKTDSHIHWDVSLCEFLPLKLPGIWRPAYSYSFFFFSSLYIECSSRLTASSNNMPFTCFENFREPLMF